MRCYNHKRDRGDEAHVGATVNNLYTKLNSDLSSWLNPFIFFTHSAQGV